MDDLRKMVDYWRTAAIREGADRCEQTSDVVLTECADTLTRYIEASDWRDVPDGQQVRAHEANEGWWLSKEQGWPPELCCLFIDAQRSGQIRYQRPDGSEGPLRYSGKRWRPIYPDGSPCPVALSGSVTDGSKKG
mgnify:CR=1 FL=1